MIRHTRRVFVFLLFQITSRGKIRALLQKNFLRMWRNVGVMLFIFVLPVMQVILFCLAIGREPTGLRLAIANMEMNDTIVSVCTSRNGKKSDSKNSVQWKQLWQIFFFHFSFYSCFHSRSKQHCPYKKECSFENLSCRYLSHLNSTMIKEYYPDPESAIEAVRIGHAWGAIYFTENFTDALVARMALGN